MTMPSNSPESVKPVLGISDCLMGREVRYNGGHKRSRYCTDVLAEFFDFKALCPEVAIGLPVPRPAIRMAQQGDQVRVIASDNSSLDYTQPLVDYAREVIPTLGHLSGYIFMQKSPSCGVDSSKVYGESGYPVERANGVFADQVIRALPLLPVTEAGQLNDRPIRENFIARVYAYHDWQCSVACQPSSAALIQYHQRHKLQLIAHSEATARALGQSLADLKQRDIHEVADQYIHRFMKATAKPAPRKRQANVLVRLHRYLKALMNEAERSESLSLIEQYRQGIVPLVVPMTLLKFFMKKYRPEAPIYEPYPHRLGLQNDI